MAGVEEGFDRGSLKALFIDSVHRKIRQVRLEDYDPEQLSRKKAFAFVLSAYEFETFAMFCEESATDKGFQLGRHTMEGYNAWIVGISPAGTLSDCILTAEDIRRQLIFLPLDRYVGMCPIESLSERGLYDASLGALRDIHRED